MTVPQALSPVAGLAANFIFQVADCRLNGRLLHSVYRGFAAGTALCAALCGLNGDLPSALLTYGALGYCYFHFVNLGETARRIRIVRELAEAGPIGLTREAVLSRYNARSMVEARFTRLLNNSQVIERNGRFYVGRRTVLLMASVMLLMKRYLLGRTSEVL